VLGVFDSTFTVQLNNEDYETPTTLQDGEPLTASLRDQGSYAYFRYYVDGRTKDFELSVTASFGDPDVYVSSSPNFTSTTGSELFPTRDKFGYSGSTSTGDTLTITPSCKPCWHLVSVYAWRIDTSQFEFEISATATRSTLVIAGSTPTTARVVQDESRYFKFLVRSASPITIVLTPLDSGNPDLYARFGTKPGNPNNMSAVGRPSVKCEPFTSTSATGMDYILVNFPAPQLPSVTVDEACTQPATKYIQPPSTLYLQVKGVTNASFSLLVLQGDSHVVPLVDGRPQAGRIGANSRQLYRLALPVTSGQKAKMQSITISVQAYVGHPSVYCSDDSGTEPTAANHMENGFGSADSNGYDPMVVRTSASFLTISVSTIGATSPSRYRLTATMGHSTEVDPSRYASLLQFDMQSSFVMEPGESRTYKIKFVKEDAQQDPVLLVDAQQGDLRVLIGGVSVPTESQSRFNSVVKAGSNARAFPLVAGTNMVVVRALQTRGSTTSFTLTPMSTPTSTPRKAITLTEGRPQKLAVQRLAYFDFAALAWRTQGTSQNTPPYVSISAEQTDRVMSSQLELVFSSSILGGDVCNGFTRDQTAQISMKARQGQPAIAAFQLSGDSSRWAAHFLDMPTGSDTMELPECVTTKAQQDPDACMLHVALCSSKPANVTIQASSYLSVSKVAIGTSTPNSLTDAMSSQQYELLLNKDDPANDELAIQLQMCSGSAMLYASHNPKPSQASHDVQTEMITTPVPHVPEIKLTEGGSSPLSLAGKSRIFISVVNTGKGAASYEMRVRHKGSEPRQQLLADPSRVGVREMDGVAAIVHGDGDGLTISLSEIPVSLLGAKHRRVQSYEVWYTRQPEKSSGLPPKIDYTWCGLLENSVQLLHQDVASLPTEPILVEFDDCVKPEAAAADSMCSIPRQYIDMDEFGSITVVVTTVEEQTGADMSRLLYTPFAYARGQSGNEDGGGGWSGFGTFVFVLFLLGLVSYVCAVLFRVHNKGIAYNDWPAVLGEAQQVASIAGSAVLSAGAMLIDYGGKGAEWAWAKWKEARQGRARIGSMPNDGMHAPLTSSEACSSAPLHASFSPAGAGVGACGAVAAAGLGAAIGVGASTAPLSSCPPNVALDPTSTQPLSLSSITTSVSMNPTNDPAVAQAQEQQKASNDLFQFSTPLNTFNDDMDD